MPQRHSSALLILLIGGLLQQACSREAHEPRPLPRSQPSATSDLTSAKPVTKAAPTQPSAVPFPFDELVPAQRSDQNSETVHLLPHPVAEGLLVLTSPAQDAFLVKGREVVSLPGFFNGLTSPDPNYPHPFWVSGVSGNLQSLSFDVYMPSTIYSARVKGTPGKFRPEGRKLVGSEAKQEDWITSGVISPPIRTPKGNLFLEEAVDPDDATAQSGFRFRALGKVLQGEPLPRPTAGRNGCKYQLLGHPVLHYLPDGSLLGFGLVCNQGSDPLDIGKVDGLAPPFQTVSARFNVGTLAVEHWKGGGSHVVTLPNAGPLAEFTFVQVTDNDEGTFISTQVSTPQLRARAYMARFAVDPTADGQEPRWSDVTPPEAPASLTNFLTRDRTLYALDGSVSFRRRAQGWERIEMDCVQFTAEESVKCTESNVSNVLEASDGTLFIFGYPRLWMLAPGAMRAQAVELPKDATMPYFVESAGTLYVQLSTSDGHSLWVRKANAPK